MTFKSLFLLRKYQKQYQKKYRQNNKEKIAEKAKNWRLLNRPQILIYQKNYRDTHKEVGIEWKKSNPDKILASKIRTLGRQALVNKVSVKTYNLALNAWSKTVKKRDGKLCIICGSKYKLHTHHILNKAENPEFALLPMNGMTVCSVCHWVIHRGEKS